MLTRLAELGIRSPRASWRRRLRARRRRRLRRAGRLAPGLRRLLRHRAESWQARNYCSRRRSTPATRTWSSRSPSPAGVDSAAARAAGLKIVDELQGPAVRHQRHVVLDGAGCAGGRPAQQGRHRRAGRRPRRRRRQHRAQARAPRSTGRSSARTTASPCKPGGIVADDPHRERPHQDRPHQVGDDRDPAHGDRADLGLRQLHRRAAAARRRAVVDHRHDGDPALARQRSPTSRSTR